MADVFRDVHLLLEREDYLSVLNRLYDVAEERINPPYDSDLNHAWYIVGDIYYRSEEYIRAISAFSKSLDAWSADPQARLALANSFSEAGKPDKAQTVLAAIDPPAEYVERFEYNIANCLFDQAKFSDAICMYKKISTDDGELYELAQRNIKAAKASIKKHRRGSS